MPKNDRPILAFDFGGTKLAAGVIDAGSGRVLSHLRADTPAAGAFAGLQIAEEIGWQAVAQAGLGIDSIAAIGVSFGGPISQDRRSVLRSMHVADWGGVDLPKRLEQVFSRPAFMDNDANAAALGEWSFGAGRGADNLIYIQISTGVGAGLILDRKLYRGGGLAGEFGHITLAGGGPRCVCGKLGCIESRCSGWALAREGRKMLRRGASPQLAEATGGDPMRISAETLLRLALASGSEPGAAGAVCGEELKIVRNAFSGLALGIGAAICWLDPELVILGGGVARQAASLMPFIEAKVHKSLPPHLQDRTQIKLSELGGVETLLGAAMLSEVE